MKWLKKNILFLILIICILSLGIAIIVTYNQKGELEKNINESDRISEKYEKLNEQLKVQEEKNKEEFKKLSEENKILSAKIALLQKQLSDEQKNSEDALLLVSNLNDSNEILKEKLNKKSSEVKQVIVDCRISESIVEFLLNYFEALREKDYERYRGYLDLEDEYITEGQPLAWFKRGTDYEQYVSKIIFYDQYGTGKGSVTDTYFAVIVETSPEGNYLLVGHKKDGKWLIFAID